MSFVTFCNVSSQIPVSSHDCISYLERLEGPFWWAYFDHHFVSLCDHISFILRYFEINVALFVFLSFCVFLLPFLTFIEIIAIFAPLSFVCLSEMANFDWGKGHKKPTHTCAIPMQHIFQKDTSIYLIHHFVIFHLQIWLFSLSLPRNSVQV